MTSRIDFESVNGKKANRITSRKTNFFDVAAKLVVDKIAHRAPPSSSLTATAHRGQARRPASRKNLRRHLNRPPISVESRVVKADLFALLTSAHDESLGQLARAIVYAPRRDALQVRRTFVRASDVMFSRAITRRIKRPR